MSWGRVENPKKVFTVGQTVKVFIKSISDTKIALSMKFDDANPWNGASKICSRKRCDRKGCTNDRFWCVC